jgi:hypothetical protein
LPAIDMGHTIELWLKILLNKYTTVVNHGD